MRRTNLMETKELDIKALRQKAVDLKKELGELLIDKNMNKLNDLKAVSKKKKDIAQVTTVLNQKLLLEKLESKVKNQEKGED